ncbi:LLM class flavin-dependent oxidoreductase [Streptomyces sp. KL116D]|uniref:LLM class flavin-dependent oxidoreductase n=1 Tax=Streptomyces sp. KL116D TaxID=3045152 RepID=UPI003558A2A9
MIFQAGVSEEGRDLAAQVAEGIYAPGGSLEQAREYYTDIKDRTAAYGRDPDHIKIFIHGGPVVATTDEAARRREREIFEEDNDFDRHLALLGRVLRRVRLQHARPGRALPRRRPPRGEGRQDRRREAHRACAVRAADSASSGPVAGRVPPLAVRRRAGDGRRPDRGVVRRGHLRRHVNPAFRTEE